MCVLTFNTSAANATSSIESKDIPNPIASPKYLSCFLNVISISILVISTFNFLL
ncbi:MAG: hypothetical protein HC778_05755 [Chamaesiphon sp. CSU_1_12]|nr:hypothetical protein [Chamaesiphon sp. CSU_1_12]